MAPVDTPSKLPDAPIQSIGARIELRDSPIQSIGARFKLRDAPICPGGSPKHTADNRGEPPKFPL